MCYLGSVHLCAWHVRANISIRVSRRSTMMRTFDQTLRLLLKVLRNYRTRGKLGKPDPERGKTERDAKNRNYDIEAIRNVMVFSEIWWNHLCTLWDQ